MEIDNDFIIIISLFIIYRKMAKRDRGRPKGSYSKPQIRDYIGNPDIKALTEKAVEMAKAGDPTM